MTPELKSESAMVSFEEVLARVRERWRRNPMLRPRIAKVTVNVCLGESGERLLKVAEMLKKLTGQEPKLRRAKRTIREFGIKRGEPIAAAVTLRGEKALSFLKKALSAVGNRLKFSSFDEHGNVSFGIAEYVSIPGAVYDPNVGMFGMDVCITVERAGYRVARRRRRRTRIPKRHRVSREEAAALLAEELGVKIVP